MGDDDAMKELREHVAHCTEALRAEVAQLKALLNYDGQRYESWLEVGQALIDRKAEVARLQQTLPATFYGDRDLHFRLERMVRVWRNAIVANQNLEKQVARLEEERDEARLDAEDKARLAHIQTLNFEAAEARIRELEEK